MTQWQLLDIAAPGMTLRRGLNNGLIGLIRFSKYTLCAQRWMHRLPDARARFAGFNDGLDFVVNKGAHDARGMRVHHKSSPWVIP